MGFDKIVLLGDSITEYSVEFSHGLHPHLERYYSRRFDIVNRGFAGYNSSHLLPILKRILKADRNIRLITIFIGTNDATLMRDVKGVIQAVPLEQYTHNVSQLVDLCLEQKIVPILIGPALHDGAQSIIRLAADNRPIEHAWGSSANKLMYSEACEKIAQEKGVTFVNLWNAFKSKGGWCHNEVMADSVDLSAFLIDGIHFTNAGYKILSDLVTEAIEQLIPHLLAKSIKQELAYFGDIDPHDLLSIFSN